MILTRFHNGILPSTLLKRRFEQCQQAGLQIEQDNNPFLTIPHHADETIAAAKRIIDSFIQQPDIIAILGIGGSILGTEAVYNTLRHTLPSPAPELWCIGTIDPLTTQHWVRMMEESIKQGKMVVLVVISKSGNTLETVTNAALFTSLFHSYGLPLSRHCIVITQHASPLHTYAQDNSIPCMYIPHALSGRFSVFSAVGMVPLMLLGIDVHSLVQGAQSATDALRNQWPELYEYTALLAAAYEYGLIVHDAFVSTPHLMAYGAWLRQLLAESLGKEQPTSQKVGFLPTVSTISEDLHSMVQLYLAGPQRTVTTFITMTYNEAPELAVPDSSLTDHFTYKITSVRAVHDALCQGVRTAYEEAQLPYASLTCADNPASVGFLMQFHMITTALLGTLWNINAFDQPQVENYKKWVRKALQSSNSPLN